MNMLMLPFLMAMLATTSSGPLTRKSSCDPGDQICPMIPKLIQLEADLQKGLQLFLPNVRKNANMIKELQKSGKTDPDKFKKAISGLKQALGPFATEPANLPPEVKQLDMMIKTLKDIEQTAVLVMPGNIQLQVALRYFLLDVPARVIHLKQTSTLR